MDRPANSFWGERLFFQGTLELLGKIEPSAAEKGAFSDAGEKEFFRACLYMAHGWAIRGSFDEAIPALG